MTDGTAKKDLQELWAKAESKLGSARHLLEGGFFDDAASRAYYAAYHAISAVLASEGKTFSSHRETLASFNRDFIVSGKVAGIEFKNIQRLFSDRQTGDYDPIVETEHETADEDIAIAAKILDACRKFLKL